MDPLRAFAPLTLVLIAACGAPPPPETTPVPFRSESGVTSHSWATTPTGTRLEACPLFTGKEKLTIVLAVPAQYRFQSGDGLGCSYGVDFQSIAVTGKASPTLRRRMERDLKPDEDIGGDDSVSDIEYASGVPAFGGRSGERLEHRCYCDGQDLQSVVYRTAGMVVSSTIPHEPKPMPKNLLPQVLPTVSVERGVFGIASSGRHAVRYGIPNGISYLSGGDVLQLGFDQPDYHRIELGVAVQPLAQERDRLSRDGTVSGLTLTDVPNAVAGRDGQRLDYEQRFPEWDNSTRVERVVVFQSGSTRVAVINDRTADLQQAFRAGLRELS